MAAPGSKYVRREGVEDLLFLFGRQATSEEYRGPFFCSALERRGHSQPATSLIFGEGLGLCMFCTLSVSEMSNTWSASHPRYFGSPITTLRPFLDWRAMNIHSEYGPYSVTELSNDKSLLQALEEISY